MTSGHHASSHKLIIGDALEVLKTMKSDSVDMSMTSPPYWGLRDYGVKGQLGLESTSAEYIKRLIEYADELKRVLKSTGSFYLNLGDTYMKKNLQMIPARVALSLKDQGWVLRNDIIWHKPNHMPASVKDRLTNTYEHLLHFVKSKRYYYDLDSIRVPHKTGPASFNYRVREAIRGRVGKVGVKSSPKEISGYDDRGQKIRGLKTKGKANINGEQHHGQDIDYHPNGKNPGDVFGYDTKFNKQCQASSLLARTAYARRVLGGDHETALNHPLGKNPGDVIQANTGLNNKKHYQNNNSHRMRLEGNMLCTNPLGKNPGDVFSGGRKSHQLFLDTHGRIGHGHYKGGEFRGVHNHPLGKNPGDVFSVDDFLKYKDEIRLRQDKNLGGKVGLAEYREWCRLNGVPEGHALGKNPGDVIDVVSETRSKEKLLSQRRRDIAEMRDEGRIHWELHPSKDPKWFNEKGKNPGDMVRANPVRHKSWMSTPGHPFTHSYTGKPRNPSDFWEIRPKPFPGAHFAVYPEMLCIMPIKSSCPVGGVVLDPFAGSGTTMRVAQSLGRSSIGIELNAKYADLVKNRVSGVKVVKFAC